MGALKRNWPLVAAVLLAGASLLLFWPGFADYDSVFQYEQAQGGEITDWHPPAMARLWQVLGAMAGAGAGPMLALQMLLYWLGLGLAAAALVRVGRGRAAAGVLAIGCWPPFLGWQAHVLKDAQMAGAALAAVGLVGWWMIQGRRVPVLGWAAAAILLGYATLVRANAAFALVPLAAMLLPVRWPLRAVAAGLGIVGAIALSGPVNHDLLGARRSGVEQSQAVYDLAGIAVRGGATEAGLTPGAARELVAGRCVKAYFWDALGDGDRCEAAMQPVRDEPTGRLYLRLATAAIRHPLAYAAHRLAHVNSTDRWLVPAGWPGAAPPMVGEANQDGLTTPGAAAAGWERLARWCVGTPLGWPVVGIVLAAGAGWVTRRRPRAGTETLARALLASGLTLEASFLVLSIASDWRYHLWPMLATALALALLGPIRRGERPAAVAGALLLAAVIGAGLVARAALPTPPQTYAGMLAA